MNGEKIMSSDAPLSDSLAVFGTAPYYTELRDRSFEIAKNLLPLCVDLRRSGTAAWDMCCVALGRCALYFEMRVHTSYEALWYVSWKRIYVPIPASWSFL